MPTVATMVADTFMKLGFVYDPLAPTAKRITVYVDGVASTTYVTGTNIATATFPDGEEMSPIMHLKAAADDDFTLTADWVQCYQLT